MKESKETKTKEANTPAERIAISIAEKAAKAELEKATLPNLSDREIQVQMLNATKSTNGWIIFIGVVTLINVIGAVITVVNLYI
tara:strand:+ start:394 stop:645 length:252 start_codon:yes stop_codon:yes gene_type:complete